VQELVITFVIVKEIYVFKSPTESYNAAFKRWQHWLNTVITHCICF